MSYKSIRRPISTSDDLWLSASFFHYDRSKLTSYNPSNAAVISDSTVVNTASFDILKRKERNSEPYKLSDLFLCMAFPSPFPRLAKPTMVHAFESSELGPASATMV